MNGSYLTPSGEPFRRLVPQVFNLEDDVQRDAFLKGAAREVTVPGSTRKIVYDPMPRIPVGMSRLGTSEAVAIGACAFALRQLDQQK